ncbi:hypothetical protein [Mesorhizobium sp.]|uniref:hypothetical protein n=1 Tax=Mesorhizobium sp. TaxID=1871066 RepID=UPI0025BBA4AB|nr:hypothetical protein [Mesorhizobium sp.]
MRAETGAFSAILLAGDRLVELEFAAPEILAAESVEAECLAAFLEIPLGLLGRGGVEILAADRTFAPI